MVFPGSVPKGRCNRRYIGHSLHNPQRKGANELHALGRHLVLELNGCNPKLLNDVKRVEEIMVAAAKIAKATIVGTHFHQFSPFGISGVVVVPNPTSRSTRGPNTGMLRWTYSPAERPSPPKS